MRSRLFQVLSPSPKPASYCLIVCCLALMSPLRARPQDKSVAPPSAIEPNQQKPSSELDSLLKEGWELFNKHQNDAAKEQLGRVLKLARKEKNAWGEGEAHRILGLIALQAATYPAAQSELEQALTLFETSQSPVGIARANMHLGLVASYMGKPAEAVDFYRRALSEFEELHDLVDQVHVLQSLAMTETVPGNEIDVYDKRALELARQIGDKGLAGHILHSVGDRLFTKGDYAGAIEKLNESASLLEESGDRAGLSRVWTSLGRLYRVHGSYDQAIATYGKGLHIQEETGDKIGVIQSLNAMAIAYGYGGHPKEEMEHYERALALARETGSPRVIAFMTGNVGGAYADRKDFKRAIALLEESLRLNPASSNAGNRYLELSIAYRGNESYVLALENADKAVEFTRKSADLDILYQSLESRSLVYQKLNGLPEALTDIENSIQVAEEIRAKLIPADYLKAGYAERTQYLFAEALQIHEQAGQRKEAMLVAEEARARAFLDLLATRGLGQGESPRTTSTATNSTDGGPPPKTVADGLEKKQPDTSTLATRGSNSLKLVEASSAPMISSRVSVAPPTFKELVSTAKRLDSALLSYWVLPDATYVWILKSDGTVDSKRIAATSEQLSKLIRATSYEEEPRSQSDTLTAQANPQTQALARSNTRGSPTIRLRGGGELVVSSKKEPAWRELYKLLILPVQESLPSRGSHLTIVPHGPLFRLSFAALQDAKGRYLVEDYALNYAPSLGVLRLTGERKQRLGQREPNYLIVADPRIAANLSQESGLPPLPGAREEARNLVRLLPHGETTLLMGRAASKNALLEQTAGRTVLHLATHAIVRDDQPFDSFLALSAGDKSPPADGRLTVQEIYGMDLQTDLVVLSACRTGLGKLSGDGIAGLTRAFFYGGTPSVMATLWDVADEPTSVLISDFYKALQKDPDKSRALRFAQLRLMRQLRAGRVKVNTSLGSLTLSEDPVFWAGFVLQGEP